ncbi:hypothetical protein DQ04_05031030 [Trypanosoma grayi]|uniref:hypothetical protein n=1 Tax=Trypanosoma grayi TaxID=71804 RepID=UPI0004F48370|nr:hypothetical protein DQ04_05031030 [Trypanosoma grayi]KEG09556.1 hypothetical protein DQ04_05031030 [Trypanosoma grayi]
MPPKRKAAAAKDAEVEECPAAADVTTTTTMTPPASPPHDGANSNASVAELYAKLQAAVAEDPANLNNFVRELLMLLTEAENAEAPLLVRVRTLEFVSRYGQHLRDGNALKRIETSLVKILSGTEDTPQLLVAAVQGISALGPVSVLDKKWEYLSREGADVLMQVMLDEEGFAENVRTAAASALDSLVCTAFRPVVTKLLHWISDDRETDDEAQLAKERRLAMTRLQRLAHAASLRPQWTEEVQEHVLGLIIVVLSAVTVREFVQLVGVAATLPIVREKGCLPLLTAFLAKNKLDNDRALESLSIISNYISATSYDITPALEEASLLTAPVETNTAKGLWHAKALLLAARLATPENLEKVYAAVLEQLTRMIGDGSVLPENLTTLEVLLFALVTVGRQKPTDLLKQLNDEAFATACRKLMESIVQIEPFVVYAVKKRIQKSTAGRKEAEALACCNNIRVMLGAFTSQHIPMGSLSESWAHKQKLPILKRSRGATATTSTVPGTTSTTGGGVASLGVLPPPPGTEEHARKRARTQGDRSHKGNRSGGRRNRNPRRGGF